MKRESKNPFVPDAHGSLWFCCKVYFFFFFFVIYLDHFIEIGRWCASSTHCIRILSVVCASVFFKIFFFSLLVILLVINEMCVLLCEQHRSNDLNIGFFLVHTHCTNVTQARDTLFFAFSLCTLCCLLASNHCSPYRCGFVLNK